MKLAILLCVSFVLSQITFAQDSNSSTTPARPRTTTQTPKVTTQQPTSTEKPAISTTAPKTTTKKPVVSTQQQQPPQTSGADGVVAAFNKLMDGIRHADVDVVTGIYWNSPGLSMFNYNGSVTKGWQQVRENRKSSYPEIKDVKLDTKELAVTMLGRDAALVTCLWSQSQVYKGNPETASGRMTLVFKRYGTAWKAIHLHSSPDAPNPAVVPPSEQLPKASPSPTP